MLTIFSYQKQSLIIQLETSEENIFLPRLKAPYEATVSDYENDKFLSI